MKMVISSFTICIVIAIWTIVQSTFHLAWLMYGHYMYTCKETPKSSAIYLIYLTYFYKKECAFSGEFHQQISVKAFCDYSLDSLSKGHLCDLANNLDLRGMFPAFGSETLNTKLLIDGLISFDCFWIISAVALLMGTIARIKEVWSVCFYYPWLIVTLLLTVMDCFTTWYFAGDILVINNTTSYLKFIGVSNYEKFQSYDELIPQIVLILPSIIMAVISFRFGIFLLLNLLSMYHVYKAARAAYTQSFREEKGRNSRGRRSPHFNDSIPNDMNLDTSAARIRSWQLFYGSGQSSSESLNSNSTGSTYNSKDSNCNSRQENCKTSNSVSVIDENRHVEIVGEAVDGQPSSLEQLRNHLPWSYVPNNNIQPNEKGPILKHTSRYTDGTHKNNKNPHH